MKQPIHTLLAIAVAALAYSSCEQVIEIELPEHTPQLIVNCTFSPDSVMFADVSISKHLQDTANLKFPTDATVIVEEDGAFFDSLKYMSLFGQGAYVGTRKPSEGRSYGIRASKSGMTTVEGQNRIPQSVAINAVSYRDSVPFGPDDQVFDEITIEFQDPAGAGNFYALAVQLRDSFEVSPGVWEVFAYNLFAASDDPTIESDFITNQLTVSDATFDGQLKSFRLRLDRDDPGFGTLHIVLASVTEDYFRYLRTMSAYSETAFNPFAEPVIIHSNMTPEMGIFAGYSMRSALVPR